VGKRKRRTILAVVLGLCLAVPVCGHFVAWGRRSPQCGEEVFDAVSRKYFPLRHWQWSGIPLLEGGFVPDPHYLCSESLTFSAPVNNLLSSRGSRYAIVDVNPFFNDNTSEILLLIQSQGNRFEYACAFPHGKNVQAILAYPMPPPAMVFPYNSGLAILADFFGPAKGVYLLPLPLRSGTILELIPATSGICESRYGFQVCGAGTKHEGPVLRVQKQGVHCLLRKVWWSLQSGESCR
jgi:hypothetical protein